MQLPFHFAFPFIFALDNRTLSFSRKDGQMEKKRECTKRTRKEDRKMRSTKINKSLCAFPPPPSFELLGNILLESTCGEEYYGNRVLTSKLVPVFDSKVSRK
ncbi:hypothetical protein CDAR_441671 [Caerostris darwini]|uniref:Uncharacterized protein n=1 Tax=Caerostris darwini TaxID=1538125 RepID=A0AAV4QUD5_9ARAC|nr:hypothetical protein CDAR_441671 [Caerostris darwini]